MSEHRCNFIDSPQSTEVSQCMRQLWNIKTIYIHFKALPLRAVDFTPLPSGSIFKWGYDYRLWDNTWHLSGGVIKMEGTLVKLSFQPWRMSTRETQKIPFKSNRGNKLQLFPAPGWRKVIQILIANKLPTKHLIVFKVKPNHILKYHFKFLCQMCQETTHINIRVFL